MTTSELLTAVNTFLLRTSGATGDVIKGYFDDREDILKHSFFQPYQSKSDPFFRAASIVTAPPGSWCLFIRTGGRYFRFHV